MSITKNTTHVAQALANRIEQFKNKDDFAALLTIYVKQVQDLEDAAFQVLLDTALDTSVGQQLDNIGEVVGEDRLSRTDDNYRNALRVQILINKSNGTREQLIAVALLFAGLSGPGQVKITAFPPASMIIEMINKLEVDPFQLVLALDEARGEGINLALLYKLSDNADTLTFSSDDTVQSSSSLGAANDAGTTGGHLADVITA